MHVYDREGELHRKQMRDIRNGMALDFTIFMGCVAVAISAFVFLGWLCGRYQ